MIDLTPLEVRQKKGDFRRSFRGYDAELVNDFLDLTADRMEELVQENLELSDRVERLEDEVTEYREKERALADALMTAQKLREESRSQAEKEAELIVREARVEADAVRQEADTAVAREHETLRQVRARRARLVQSFRRLLEREIDELEVIEETLELDEVEPDTAGERDPEPGTAPFEGDPELVDVEPGAAPTGDGPAEPIELTELEEVEAAPSDEERDEGSDEDIGHDDWLASLVEEDERPDSRD